MNQFHYSQFLVSNSVGMLTKALLFITWNLTHNSNTDSGDMVAQCTGNHEGM